MNEDSHVSRINGHYARPGLTDAILRGLRDAGKDPAQCSYDDLSPVDHFHTLGKQATIELATLARVATGTRVLDVGGGLGGPARMLAAEYGCEVAVLDLTEVYCRIGELLTERAGLTDRVSFRQGDALNLPFEDASFDLVWTQHCTKNLEDKARLYRELARVLRPEGALAFHEIMAGPMQPIHFPVPWASAPELSFLQPPATVCSLIEEAGLAIEEFRDGTAAVGPASVGRAGFAGCVSERFAQLCGGSHGRHPGGLSQAIVLVRVRDGCGRRQRRCRRPLILAQSKQTVPCNSSSLRLLSLQ